MIKTAWMICTILLVLLFTFPSAYPQIYRWTDKKGTIHFTDSPSSLPEDYKEEKKRDPEKKSTSPNEKSEPEKRSITPLDKPKLESKSVAEPVKPKLAEKKEGVPPEPAEPKPLEPKALEPAKPTGQDGQDQVIVQIKPTEENAIKQSAPEEKAPTPGKIEFGKALESPPAVPGDPVNTVRMKTTMKVGAFVGILGIIISVIGGIWFLVAAFKVSVKWGLLCLFLPFVQLIFLFTHWKQARKPFAVGLLAMGIIFVAIFLMVEEPLLFLRQYSQFK